MRMISRLPWVLLSLTLFLALVACDKPKEEKKEKPEPKAIETLFEGNEPSLPVVLEGFSWDMKKEAFMEQYGATEFGEVELEGYDKVYLVASYYEDKLDSLSLQTKVSLTEILTGLWGQPIKEEVLGSPILVWRSETHALKASLDPQNDQFLRLIQAKPITHLISENQVQLPTPIAKLEFGLTEEAIKKDFPNLTELGMLRLTGFEDASVNVDLAFGRLRGITLHSDFITEALLSERWGAPTKGKEYNREMSYWYNPELKLRAKLDTINTPRLIFQPYSSILELLGDRRDQLALAKSPLIGSSQEELAKTFGKWTNQLDDKLTLSIKSIELPPLETGSSLMLTLQFKDKMLKDYSFFIPIEDEAAAKPILDHLQGQFGDPTERADFMSDKPKKVYQGEGIQVVAGFMPNLGFEIRVEAHK